MQKVITATYRQDFEKKVTALLSEGWRIVPNTVSIAITSTDSGPENFHSPILDERYVAFFEKA